MAHIRENTSGRGRQWVVSYRNEKTGQNAKASRKTLDEAMHELWLAETSQHQLTPPADTRAAVFRWPVRKVVWYWLGERYACTETGRLRPDSYRCYRQLLGLPESLLREPVNKITPRQLKDLHLSKARRDALRRAFALLVRQGWLEINPVGSAPGKPSREINLPEKKTVRTMLAAARTREKIAILLGAVCGLRPSELISLRYSDLSANKIVIRRHLTRTGEIPGTKRNERGRSVDMPAELWALLDKSLLGSSAPVIAGRGGQRLSLNYTTSGVMKNLLEEYGVEQYYDLRHFAVTNLLKRGATLEEGARFAGHSDASVTAKHYLHLLGKLTPLTGSLDGE
ncbi:MAG: tyrosine-type recombinase/integrase [Yokenella regensburgei]|jgi:integrase|nr:tyrosine-type recombinase/integrase [Yokenella regensburgei]